MKFISHDGRELDIPTPEWINYLAQDQDGLWFGYNKLPYPSISFTRQWLVDWDSGNGGRSVLLCKGKRPKDWTQELYEIHWE